MIDLYAPGSAEYAAGTSPHNSSGEQHPAYVAHPLGADGVAAADALDAEAMARIRGIRDTLDLDRRFADTRITRSRGSRGKDLPAVTDAVTVPARRRLRADAEGNRQRVLAAAVTAILREGSHVPLATIAAEAKVGVGTLYRRYPDRDALFDALAIRSYGLVIDLLHEVLDTDESGIDALDRFLRRTIAHRDQLVLPYHGAPRDRSVEAQKLRRHLAELMADVVERGRRDGTIRPAVQPEDIIIFGALLAQPLPNVDGWDVVALTQKDYFLRGIHS